MLPGVGDTFAGKAEWFDEHYGTVRGRVRLDLVLERLKHLLPPPPARVLDAGGGTGAYAIPLAEAGHDVTVLERSAEWLERCRLNAAAAGVDVQLVEGSVETAANTVAAPFDTVLCHAVLMYLPDPTAGLRALRSVAREGAVLSLLEKNRDGLALRPGLQGDFAEAHRLLTERDSAGRLGIQNRAHSVGEWGAMLEASGWQMEDWVGIRLFSDLAPDDLDADTYESLLNLERAVGAIDPYRQVARLVHVVARAIPSRPS